MKTGFSSKTWSFFNSFGGFWYVKVYVLHISTYTTGTHHQQLHGPTLAEDVSWKTAILHAQLHWLGTGEKMSGIWWLRDAGPTDQTTPKNKRVNFYGKNAKTHVNFGDILVCTTPSQTHVFPVTQHRLHRNMTRCFCFRWLFCWRGVMLVEGYDVMNLCRRIPLIFCVASFSWSSLIIDIHMWLTRHIGSQWLESSFWTKLY